MPSPVERGSAANQALGAASLAPLARARAKHKKEDDDGPEAKHAEPDERAKARTLAPKKLGVREQDAVRGGFSWSEIQTGIMAVVNRPTPREGSTIP
jgi:cell division septation protein DedD